MIQVGVVRRAARHPFRGEYGRLQREYARLRAAAFKHDNVTRRLLTDGVVVLPNFFEGSAIRELRRAIPPIEECQVSPEGTRTRFFLNADRLAPLAPFFKSELISTTMRNVLGPTATMFRAVAQYRTELGNFGAFENFFHLDTWRPRYKAFLYLTDVSYGNGPFTYTPRTHYGGWRTRFDHDIADVFKAGAHGLIQDDESAYVGCLWPHEYARVCRQLKTAPLTITGDAGTLILFDARGLHRIPPMDYQPRIILSSYWIREGLHS